MVIRASVNRISAGFFCFVAVACISVNIVVAQSALNVRSITLQGNDAFGTREILSWLATREGVAFSESVFKSDLERIVQRYAAEGYLFTRVDSSGIVPALDATQVDLVIHIQESKPAVIDSVRFEGNLGMQEQGLRELLSARPGVRFRPGELEADVRRLLQKYEQVGFPFAKINIRDVKLSEGSSEYFATIVLAIDAGRAVTVSEIRIEGNQTTKDFVVTREARIREGEPFRGDLPARIKRRLDRLQLFSSVSMPELYVNQDGRVGLLVRLTEGNPNRFDGVLGYVPSSIPQETGYFTGLVNVQFRNLFGTGRKLSTRWHREERTTQEFELRYLEPWVASYPLNVDLGFFQRKQDSAYIRRQYEVNAELMITEELRAGASFTQADVFSAEDLIRPVVANSSTKTLGALVFYDSRDDPVTPTDGILYRTEYHTGLKKISKSAAQPSSDQAQRVTLDFEYFASPFERNVVASGLHIRDFRSGFLEVSDLFRLGGATTLRGYREGQFLGSRVVWSNFEYRLLVAPRSFVFTFVDVGYFTVGENPSVGLASTEQTKIGYGAGIRLDTALGLIGVSVAFGQGDTFSTAKLHLRLMNEF